MKKLIVMVLSFGLCGASHATTLITWCTPKTRVNGAAITVSEIDHYLLFYTRDGKNVVLGKPGRNSTGFITKHDLLPGDVVSIRLDDINGNWSSTQTTIVGKPGDRGTPLDCSK